jgi:hypothetical protein
MAFREKEYHPPRQPEPGDFFWNVEARRAALKREVAKREMIRDTLLSVKTSISNADFGIKIWDLQEQLENADSERADLISICIGELEGKFFKLNPDGTFELA